MSSPDLTGFANEIRRSGLDVHGLEIWQDGRLAASFGDTRDTRWPIYSVTKSMVSVAAGMAAEEGRLDISAGVLRYLPGEYVRDMKEEQKRSYEQITLRRLMSMSVPGFPFRPSGSDWLREALSVPLKGPRAFAYSNVPAYLAGVAVSVAVGERLDRYLGRKLFSPLGIPDPPCLFSPEGFFYGASGMELSVNELSRVGLMLSHGGEYAREQIVPASYVKEAVSVQQMNREGGYGYFFWKYRDGFSMNGKWGQKCYVLPSRNMVVTFLSHQEEGADRITACMEKYLIDN